MIKNYNTAEEFEKAKKEFFDALPLWNGEFILARVKEKTGDGLIIRNILIRANTPLMAQKMLPWFVGDSEVVSINTATPIRIASCLTFSQDGFAEFGDFNEDC